MSDKTNSPKEETTPTYAELVACIRQAAVDSRNLDPSIYDQIEWAASLGTTHGGLQSMVDDLDAAVARELPRTSTTPTQPTETVDRHNEVSTRVGGDNIGPVVAWLRRFGYCDDGNPRLTPPTMRKFADTAELVEALAGEVERFREALAAIAYTPCSAGKAHNEYGCLSGCPACFPGDVAADVLTSGEGS